MYPVRPCGVSDCGSSAAVASAFGTRTSSTIDSSSPRQTPTAPQTLCAHSPAGTVSPLSSLPPTAAPMTITARTPTVARIQGSGPRMLLPGLRHLVDEGDEQRPEALDGGDAHALVGRMRELDLGAEREHVEAGHLGPDHGRLEAGVNRGDDRRLAELPLVDHARGRQRGRVELGPPATVVALDLELATAEPRRCVEGRDHLGERRVVRGAREAVQRQLVTFGDRFSEGRARLDEVVEVGAQGERAGW